MTIGYTQMSAYNQPVSGHCLPVLGVWSSVRPPVCSPALGVLPADLGSVIRLCIPSVRPADPSPVSWSASVRQLMEDRSVRRISGHSLRLSLPSCRCPCPSAGVSPFSGLPAALRAVLSHYRRRIVHPSAKLRLSSQNFESADILSGDSVQIQDSGSCFRSSGFRLLLKYFFWILLPQYYTPYHVIMSPAGDPLFPCDRPSPWSADSGIWPQEKKNLVTVFPG